MKYRDLTKQLKQLGATFVREGSSHEIWIINGEQLQIPRHKEIAEPTARRIIKQAKQAEKGQA